MYHSVASFLVMIFSLLWPAKVPPDEVVERVVVPDVEPPKG